MILLVYALYFLVIPIAVCVLDYKCKRVFSGYWKPLWVFGYSLLSWGLVLACVWIPYRLGVYSIRGPEIAFAMCIGWAYLWVSSVPVFLAYGAFRWLKSR